MLEFLKKLFGSKKEDTSGVYIPPAYKAPQKNKSTSIDDLMNESKSTFTPVERIVISTQQESEKEPVKKSTYTIEEEWCPFEQDGLYGFKDENDNIVIPPTFQSAYYFKNGYSIVEMKTGKGMINNKGAFILEPIYDYIFDDVNGFLQIEKDSLYGLAKTDGSIAIPVKYIDTGEFSEGLVWVENKDFMGYVDEQNRTVIDFKFDWCGNFSEGLAYATQYAVEEGQDDKTGFIDKNGNFVIHLDYDEAGDFKEGLAPVSINDKYTYITKKGEFICEPTYQSAGNFVQGLSCVQLKKDGKWGYADKTGKLVIPCQFDSTSDYIDDQDELNELISGLKTKYSIK